MKPTVTFEKLLRFDDTPNCRRAWLIGIEGHPNQDLLGDLVRTSNVIDVMRDGDGISIIETENTIYVRKS